MSLVILTQAVLDKALYVFPKLELARMKQMEETGVSAKKKPALSLTNFAKSSQNHETRTKRRNSKLIFI
jgi:hypothetical protein